MVKTKINLLFLLAIEKWEQKQKGQTNNGFPDTDFHLVSNTSKRKDGSGNPTSLKPVVIICDDSQSEDSINGESNIANNSRNDINVEDIGSFKQDTPVHFLNVGTSIEGSISSKRAIIANNRKTDKHSNKWIVDVKPTSTTVDDDFIVQRKRRFQISYEYIVWIIFFIVTTLCIIDRFVKKGDTVLERKG